MDTTGTMDTMATTGTVIPTVASGTGGSDKGGIDTGSEVGSEAGVHDRALPVMTQYRLDLWRKTTAVPPPTTTGRRGRGGKGTRGGSRRQHPVTGGTEEPA